MFGKKQKTIDYLRNRVKELEEKICHAESHKWVYRDTIFEDYLVFNRKYICTKCGKIEWRSEIKGGRNYGL